MAARPTASEITDDQLDALYAERDELLAERGGRDKKARKRWLKHQEEQLGIRFADFRAGRWEMSLAMARDMGAAYVAMAKTLLGDSPNYSETRLEFDVKIAESPELYTLVVQRHGPGTLTPHEARQQAQGERDLARRTAVALEQDCARLEARVRILEHDARPGTTDHTRQQTLAEQPGPAAELAPMFEGLQLLLATNSRDWGTDRVDAWLWAVLLGWDCKASEHDDTCTHGAMEEMQERHGWDEDAVAKARRYRAAVRRTTAAAEGSTQC